MSELLTPSQRLMSPATLQRKVITVFAIFQSLSVRVVTRSVAIIQQLELSIFFMYPHIYRGKAVLLFVWHIFYTYLFNVPLGESSQKTTSVLESTGNESMKKLLLVFFGHESLNSGYVLRMIEGCFGGCLDVTGEGQI